MLAVMLPDVLFSLGLTVLHSLQPGLTLIETAREDQPASLPAITAIRRYADPLFDFSMAVPVGWQAIVMDAERITDDAMAAQAYAVGFASPPSRDEDAFADFVMVEILPGDASGAFSSDGRHAERIRIDGRHAVRDRIVLDRFALHDTPLDLLVLQAIVAGTGYEIGLYAIGEQREMPVLETAFELLIQTFRLSGDPYSVF